MRNTLFDCTQMTKHIYQRVALVSARRRFSCRSLLFILRFITLNAYDAFEFRYGALRWRQMTLATHRLLSSVNDDGDRSELDFMNDLISRADKLQVERERGRLEEATMQAMLKRKPRKLPYEDARRWIQANLGPNTKEEFLDLVENGNLRTPYIPKRPEEYYTETREWISWDHFLTGIFDKERPSAVGPQTGIFD
jgi:hypothetical protein